jgi:hypothetical protein
MGFALGQSSGLGATFAQGAIAGGAGAALVCTLTGKSVRTIAANATAAGVVRSIGFAERGVTVAPATGIEVLVRVGFKWRKIAQG